METKSIIYVSIDLLQDFHAKPFLGRIISVRYKSDDKKKEKKNMVNK